MIPKLSGLQGLICRLRYRDGMTQKNSTGRDPCHEKITLILYAKFSVLFTMLLMKCDDKITYYNASLAPGPHMDADYVTRMA